MYLVLLYICMRVHGKRSIQSAFEFGIKTVISVNNNNTFDMYFYNIQICIFTTLIIEQQYLNTAIKWDLTFCCFY